MVDFLGDLQPAGDDSFGFTPGLEAWQGDEEEEQSIRNRHSPPARPFSSLEEEMDNEKDDSVTEAGAGPRYTHSPVCISDDYMIEDSILYATVPDPIRLRGVGGTTMFGLNNHFEDGFPSHLLGKVLVMDTCNDIVVFLMRFTGLSVFILVHVCVL